MSRREPCFWDPGTPGPLRILFTLPRFEVWRFGNSSFRELEIGRRCIPEWRRCLRTASERTGALRDFADELEDLVMRGTRTDRCDDAGH